MSSREFKWNITTILVIGTILSIVSSGLNGAMSVFWGYHILDYPTIVVMSYFSTFIFIFLDEFKHHDNI